MDVVSPVSRRITPPSSTLAIRLRIAAGRRRPREARRAPSHPETGGSPQYGGACAQRRDSRLQAGTNCPNGIFDVQHRAHLLRDQFAIAVRHSARLVYEDPDKAALARASAFHRPQLHALAHDGALSDLSHLFGPALSGSFGHSYRQPTRASIKKWACAHRVCLA